MSETKFPEFVKGLPELDLPFEGVTGWVVQGETQQVAFLEFTKTVEVPEHSHEEQWEFVIDGRVELRVDGKPVEHNAGSNFFIPADVPHAATVYAGYRAMIVFNSPNRYSTKK